MRPRRWCFPAAISMDEQPYVIASVLQDASIAVRFFYRLFGLDARTGGVCGSGNAVNDALLAVRACTHRKDEPYSPPTRLPARLPLARPLCRPQEWSTQRCKSLRDAVASSAFRKTREAAGYVEWAAFNCDWRNTAAAPYLIQASGTYRAAPGPPDPGARLAPGAPLQWARRRGRVLLQDYPEMRALRLSSAAESLAGAGSALLR